MTTDTKHQSGLHQEARQLMTTVASPKRLPKTIADIVRPARQYDSKVGVFALAVIQHVASRTHGSYSYSREYAASLKKISNRFGLTVLAKTVRFQYTNQFYLINSFTLEKVARQLAADNEEILHRSYAFIVRYKLSTIHFTTVLNGLEKWGEQELMRGMALTPRPPRIPSDPRVAKHWNRNREWRWAKESYCRYTAELGYKQLKTLLDFLKSHGLSNETMQLLIISCANADRRKAKTINLVYETVGLLKPRGLPIEGFLTACFLALHERHGAIAEVIELLDLAVEHGLSEIHHTNFQYAIEFWRQPGKRPVVIEAFATQYPGLLSRLSLGISLTEYFAAATAGSMEPLIKHLAENYRTEALARTSELLAARFSHKYGLTRLMQPMVMLLASNPLLPNEVLLPRAAYSEPNRDWLAAAEQHYGREEVRRLCQTLRNVLPEEAALALRRATPQQITRLMHQVGNDELAVIVRSIGWYGVGQTQLSLSIARSCGLDVSAVYSIARKVTVRCKYLAIVSPSCNELGIAEVVTNEHRIAHKAYLSLPATERQNLARAVRLYRRVFGIIYWRMATRRV